MKTNGQAQNRRVELAGHEGWTLSGYAWRSRHLKSPLTGDAMRAVVGVDEKGRYRPAVRTNGTSAEKSGGEVTTVFDVKPAADKAEAVSKSREMLMSELIDHARLAAEATQKPGEIAEVRVEARAIAIAEGSDSGAAAKYGASKSIQSELPPPKRSR